MRWLSRHRVGVTAAGAALLVALAGTGAVLAVQTRANRELKAANERERTRLRLAQEAIRTFHSGVSEDILLKEEQFEALRSKLLRGAREFYRKLEGLLQGQEDRNSRLDLGRAYYEVGELSRELESIVEAGEVHRRAVALFETLSSEDPAHPEPRRAAALGLRSLAVIFTGIGHHDDALSMSRRSRDLFRALAEADQADWRRRIEWARAEMLYGMSLSLNRRPAPEVLEPVERGRSILEAIMDAGPPSADIQPALTDAYGALALALEDAGRQKDALSAYERACKLGEVLFKANPTNPTIGHEFARNLGNMGIRLRDAGRLEDAIAGYDRAIAVLKVATDANPTLIRLPAAAAWIEASRAEALVSLGRDSIALEALDRARIAREILIKANPTVTRNLDQLIPVHRQIADIHRRAGRMPALLESLEQARQSAATLAAAHPQNNSYRDDLIAAYTDLGDVHSTLGKVAETASSFDQALAIRRRSIEAKPSTDSDKADLARVFRGRGLNAAMPPSSGRGGGLPPGDRLPSRADKT